MGETHLKAVEADVDFRLPNKPPPTTIAECQKFLSELISDLECGKRGPKEGQATTQAILGLVKILREADLEQRLAALEAAQAVAPEGPTEQRPAVPAAEGAALPSPAVPTAPSK